MTGAMPEKTVIVSNKLGLHARASAKLTQLAAKYPCEITLARNGRTVNAKSIMGVMMLAAGLHTEVTVRTEGPDADDALAAVVRLFEDKFGEGE